MPEKESGLKQGQERNHTTVPKGGFEDYRFQTPVMAINLTIDSFSSKEQQRPAKDGTKLETK